MIKRLIMYILLCLPTQMLAENLGASRWFKMLIGLVYSILMTEIIMPWAGWRRAS